jgi:hypothetical protein
MGKTPIRLKSPPAGEPMCIFLSKAGYHNATIDFAPGERRREIAVEMIGLRFSESLYFDQSGIPDRCLPPNMRRHFDETTPGSRSPLRCPPFFRTLRITHFLSAEFGAFYGVVAAPYFLYKPGYKDESWYALGDTKTVVTDSQIVAAVVGVQYTANWRYFNAGFGVWLMPKHTFISDNEDFKPAGDYLEPKYWMIPYFVGPIIGINIPGKLASPYASLRIGLGDGGWGDRSAFPVDLYAQLVSGFKLKLSSWLAFGVDGGILAAYGSRSFSIKLPEDFHPIDVEKNRNTVYEYHLYGGIIRSNLTFFF